MYMHIVTKNMDMGTFFADPIQSKNGCY